MQKFDVPFVRGKIRYLQLDRATFLESAFISEEGGWPVVGGAPDDAVAIFTRVNSPLQGAGEGQTVELVIKVMYHLLPGIVLGTGREKSDTSPFISEMIRIGDCVVCIDDTIDARRQLRRSSHSALG